MFWEVILGNSFEGSIELMIDNPGDRDWGVFSPVMWRGVLFS
jgi:hypothetical protein